MNPWPEIAEAIADGETARLYNEIHKVTGIPLVNLIYRHIATFPGGLSWTWNAVRPLYESNVAGELGKRIIQNFPLPATPQIPKTYFTAAGLSQDDLNDISAILEFYIRGNTGNLIALSALGHALEGKHDKMVALPSSRAMDNQKFPGMAIRPILKMDELNIGTREMVASLNRLGEGPVQDSVTPSLFRHLAYWPVFLSLAGVFLLPLEVNGWLESGAQAVREKANAESATIAGHIDLTGTNRIDSAGIAKIQTAIGHFANRTIPRLLVICILLRRMLSLVHSPTGE